MWALIVTLFVGLIVGLIARMLKPGNDSMGFFMTALLGVAGSFLASFIGQQMGWYQYGEAAGWIASVLGAIAVLFIYGLITSKK